MKPLKPVQRKITTVNYNGEDLPLATRIGRGGYLPLKDYTDASMQRLGHLVLDNKKDIKYSEAAAIYPRAEKFAKTRGLILGPYEDINNDGREDVILYDKKGNVRYINGYSLAPSTHRMREKFYHDYPTKAARASVGGWSSYRKGFLERDDAAEWLADPKQENYFVPKPRRAGNSNTVYNKFIKEINGFINTGIASIAGEKTNCKSLVSSFTVASIAYINSVLRVLWNLPANNTIKEQICMAEGNPIVRYERFKKVMAGKENKEIVDRQYEENKGVIIENANEGVIGQIFNDIGYKDENIAQMPNDVDFVMPAGLSPEDRAGAREHILGAKAHKQELKDHITQAAAELKEHLIVDIFGNMPAFDALRPRPVNEDVAVMVHSFINMPPQDAQATINAMRERQPENYARIREYMASVLEGNRANEGFMRVWSMFT